MQTLPGARIAAALLSCSLLAACGGGGGGSAPVTGPTTAPPAGTSRSVVRSDAQAILDAGKVLGTGGYSPGGPPLGPMAVVRHVQSHRSTQAVQCQSGGISGVGSVSVVDTTDAQGNSVQTYTDYYDASCQQTERVATLIFPPGGGLSSSGTATGSTAEYDRTNTLTGYATFQSSYSQTSMTVQTADSKTIGGAVVGRSGATCNVTGNTTETCGFAAFATVGGTTTGITESVAGTFTQTGQITYTATAQLTATTYTGSALALVPPASGGTAWGLSGGTQLDSLTGTANASYNGSIATSSSYSFSDATAGITASGSISGTSLTITLVQSSATVATITVDADGNGTVTYASDGAKENVAGFTIFG